MPKKKRASCPLMSSPIEKKPIEESNPAVSPSIGRRHWRGHTPAIARQRAWPSSYAEVLARSLSDETAEASHYAKIEAAKHAKAEAAKHAKVARRAKIEAAQHAKADEAVRRAKIEAAQHAKAEVAYAKAELAHRLKEALRNIW